MLRFLTAKVKQNRGMVLKIAEETLKKVKHGF